MFRSEASGETFGLLAAKAGLLLSSLLEEEWLQLAQLKQGSSSFSAPGGRCQVKENQQCENCLAFCRKRPEPVAIRICVTKNGPSYKLTPEIK